jgi:drug/metabolite transporter (DMT)-like permease
MYYFLVLSVFTASFNSIILNRSGVRKKEEVFGFNFIGAFLWCIMLFIIAKGNITLSFDVVFWGILYGLVQALFILFKTLAMSTGSVAVTTLIGNSSLLISIFVSLLVWKEKVTLIDISGLLLLCLAIYLCTYKKNKVTHTPQWKYYTVFFLIFAASVGIVFKAFGKSGNLEYCNDMMFIAAIFMTLFYLSVHFWVGGFQAGYLLIAPTKKILICALLSGALSCLYNRLNVFISGSMDAIVFFPVFNGGVVLLSTVLSVMILTEKLSSKQLVGVVTGIIAIYLIGIL